MKVIKFVLLSVMLIVTCLAKKNLAKFETNASIQAQLVRNIRY